MRNERQLINAPRNEKNEKEGKSGNIKGRTRHPNLGQVERQEKRQCLPLSASQTGASSRPETRCF